MRTDAATTASPVRLSKTGLLPAARFRRAGAWLINATLNTAAATALLAAVLTAGTRTGPTQFAGVGVAAVAGWLLVRWNVTDVVHRGGKPGHRATRIKIVSITDQPVTTFRASARVGIDLALAVTIIGAIAVAAIDLGLIVFDSDRRRVADRLTDTWVTQPAPAQQEAQR